MKVVLCQGQIGRNADRWTVLWSGLRGCGVVHAGQPRSTKRRQRQVFAEEGLWVREMAELAIQHGRYGYRQITALLPAESWQVNHKRVERLWRRT